MREILFRGKCNEVGKYNGQWIEGFYGEDDGKPIIARSTDHGLIGYFCEPDSIGQYTGLTDKNGRKIFEGDILSIAQKGNGIGDYFYPPLKYPSNAIVKWDKCSWMWEIIAEQRYYLTFPDAWCHFECKIIGNIHDNPELLGGESDG